VSRRFAFGVRARSPACGARTDREGDRAALVFDSPAFGPASDLRGTRSRDRGKGRAIALFCDRFCDPAMRVGART
jgi:hypothetical protein